MTSSADDVDEDVVVHDDDVVVHLDVTSTTTSSSRSVPDDFSVEQQKTHSVASTVAEDKKILILRSEGSL